MNTNSITIGLVLALAVTAHAQEPASAATADKAQAQQIFKQTGVTGGLVVHVGCADGKLTAALRASDSFVVHGLDADVTEARKNLHAAGVYGPVSVDRWSGGALPYADSLVRLLVIGNAGKLSREEVERVLCPGGVAYALDPSSFIPHPFRKPWPAEIDEWPQHYHGADNNAVAKDSVVGPPRHYQWIAEPIWQRSHLAMPSINCLVSAQGRVFTIEDLASAEHPALPGQFALVARDAFNGIVLWQHRFPDWHPITLYVKYTPVQLQRRLAAIGDRVYCTPGWAAPITAFDAASGKILRSYGGTEQTREFVYDDGIVYAIIGDPHDTAGAGKLDPIRTIGTSAFPPAAYGPVLRTIENPVCKIMALAADSGKTIWEKTGADTAGYQGASLAAQGDHAVYCTTTALICLNRRTGAEVWRKPISLPPSPMPGLSVSLVLGEKAVYLADDKTLTAFARGDGARLWSAPTVLNHVKSADVFLAAGAVWTANNQAMEPLTGRPLRTLPQKKIGPMSHPRCYRNRITERWYLNSLTGGTDFLALDGTAEFPNSWARSTCGIGYLPCNGLLYVGPPACGCYNMVQLNYFNALAPNPNQKSPTQPITVPVQPRLENGPAFESTLNEQPAAGDWPTYRQNMSRDGRTGVTVSATLAPLWQTRLRTRPSAPVIANGKVFVADVDAHAVCALNAGDGRVLWTYVTGGRVDSPPTFHQGRVLFGSRDGWVYCLRAADGVLAWRFKALPDRLIVALGQLESAWPVPGSILVKDNVAYFAAGRNSFLDGGIFLFGLDPATGWVLHQRHLDGPYDADGFPVTAKGTNGFGIWGHKGDVLLADDRQIYLRHQAFQPDLTPVDFTQARPRLITSAGFTQAVPHHRSFWTIDNLLRFDIAAGNNPSHGDILVRDGSRYYEVRGYKPGRNEPFDPRKDGYTLFAGELGGRRQTAGAPAFGWSVNIPLTGKALALANDVLFVAGTPVKFPEEDLGRAYEGRSGGVLWAAAADTGKKLAEYKLDAPPVWDSLAVADGRLYLATTDGHVRCYTKETK